MAQKPCPRCGGTGQVQDDRSKLDIHDRADIRRRLALGELQKDLASAFKVSPATISRLAKQTPPSAEAFKIRSRAEFEEFSRELHVRAEDDAVDESDGFVIGDGSEI